MEKQKLVDFDFKKIVPLENSETERKISRIVTKKFLALSFVIAFGFGFGSHLFQGIKERSEKAHQLETERNIVTQHATYKFAQENRDVILANLEQQATMYDDIIKDIFETNQQIPNSAQTILSQNDQIRGLSQAYKENITKIINNFTLLVSSENLLTKASSEEQTLFLETVKKYQVGSLTRNSELENLLMTYTTTANDEKKVAEKAQVLRQELKVKVVEKMSNLLSSNDITKFKKLKIK